MAGLFLSADLPASSSADARLLGTICRTPYRSPQAPAMLRGPAKMRRRAPLSNPPETITLLVIAAPGIGPVAGRAGQVNALAAVRRQTHIPGTDPAPGSDRERRSGKMRCWILRWLTVRAGRECAGMRSGSPLLDFRTPEPCCSQPSKRAPLCRQSHLRLLREWAMTKTATPEPTGRRRWSLPRSSRRPSVRTCIAF